MKVDSKDSPLFLVRLWDGGEERSEQGAWHGKVLHVVSGQAHYFTGWSELEAAMQEMAAPRDGGHSGQHPEVVSPGGDGGPMLLPQE